MVFAHGIGGAKDLPIPAGYAIAGAGLALAVSFVVLALAWRTPRFDAAHTGRPALARLAALVDSPVSASVLRALGLAFACYVGWAAVAGPDLLTNPTFGVVYVLLWVGIVPASVLLGPFYRAVSPVRALHAGLTRLTGGEVSRGLFVLPARVGCWPAALGLLAFVWLELVYPGATYLSPVRLWFAGYLVVVVVGALLFGDDWFAAADPFEVYSTLAGQLSVFGRLPPGAPSGHGGGTLVLRSPLATLDGLPVRPGLVGVVAVLSGSTAFDSFQDSTRWLTFTQSVSTGSTLVDLAALLACCLVVGVTFAAATMATGVGRGVARHTLPDVFAHSVVPIVVGYVVAHYLSYLVQVGQQTLVQLSDPLGRGWNVLGTAHWPASYWLSEHPTLLAVLKVASVVAGHVLGVVAAHDRALKVLPPRHRLSGQLPLLAVMVGYTVTGLSLLFGA